MNVDVLFSVHDTDPGLYAALVRVFGEKTSDEYRWVDIRADGGVRMNFFFSPPEEAVA